MDLDSDNDGFADWLEIAVGSEPSDQASVPGDASEDGVPDVLVGPAGERGLQGERGERGDVAPKAPRAPR